MNGALLSVDSASCSANLGLMKTLILFSLFLFASVSQAATQVTFSLGIAMIHIYSQSAGGGSSSDPVVIYEAMKVPAQNGVMGPGKSIVTPDKALSFVCGQGPRGYQCAINLKNAEGVKISPLQQMAEYQVSGEMADFLASQFHLDNQQSFQLITDDGKFLIDVKPQTFTLKYNGKGL